MKSIIEYLKSLMSSEKKGWLSGLKEKDRPAIRKLVETDIVSERNHIGLMHDPVSGVYWIQHYFSGEFDWMEYQPISAEQAQAIKDNPDNFRHYVLHDNWE